jgi:hypothetical protein
MKTIEKLVVYIVRNNSEFIGFIEAERSERRNKIALDGIEKHF